MYSCFDCVILNENYSKTSYFVYKAKHREVFYTFSIDSVVNYIVGKDNPNFVNILMEFGIAIQTLQDKPSKFKE